MIIGIDFDGTIADTNSVKSTWIAEHLGMAVPPYLCDHTCCAPIIGEDNYARMCEVAYSRAATVGFEPLPGVLDVLAELDRDHELIVVTARYGEMVESVRTWLQSRDVTRDIEIIAAPRHGASKPRQCRERGIRVLIDDDESHLLPAPDQDVHPLLMKPAAPADFKRNGLPVCRSWADARRLILEVASPH
jgi:hypothetical protein